jgi:hypothetical protein
MPLQTSLNVHASGAVGVLSEQAAVWDHSLLLWKRRMALSWVVATSSCYRASGDLSVMEVYRHMGFRQAVTAACLSLDDMTGATWHCHCGRNVWAGVLLYHHPECDWAGVLLYHHLVGDWAGVLLYRHPVCDWKTMLSSQLSKSCWASVCCFGIPHSGR